MPEQPNFDDALHRLRMESLRRSKEIQKLRNQAAERRAAEDEIADMKFQEVFGGISFDEGESGKPDTPITLAEAALHARASKRKLQDEELPPPDIKGGKGKAHKWFWRRIRPVLLKFNPSLPEEYPPNPFHRRFRH